MYLRMTLNPWSFYHLPIVRIMGLPHHTQFYIVLRTEPRTLYMLGKHYTTQLHPQPLIIYLIKNFHNTCISKEKRQQ